MAFHEQFFGFEGQFWKTSRFQKYEEKKVAGGSIEW